MLCPCIFLQIFLSVSEGYIFEPDTVSKKDFTTSGMNPMTVRLFSLALFALTAILAWPVMAANVEPWQLSMQPAVSPSATHIHEFHNMLLWIIFSVAIFVFLLVFWVCLRYNSKANPKPSSFSHNVMVEVIWTVIPILILIIIALPSFKLLYYTDRVENPDMTLKITGRQWYWDYEYPDHEGIAFSSYMIQDADIDASKGQKRLLSTDNAVVLPVETNIQILTTAGDVIHSWAVPAFGIKLDAVPGRTNETWVRIEKPGVYYGQCSELCGKDHSYMPIEIHAVTKEEFERWLVEAKKEFASYSPASGDHGSLQFAYLED